MAARAVGVLSDAFRGWGSVQAVAWLEPGVCIHWVAGSAVCRVGSQGW